MKNKYTKYNFSQKKNIKILMGVLCCFLAFLVLSGSVFLVRASTVLIEEPEHLPEKLTIEAASSEPAEEKAQEAVTIPESYQIENFPVTLQMPQLPTGCEITALTMALNYYGYDADKITMAHTYLPKAELGTYYGTDGCLYGNNLDAYFIGDPFSAEAGISCGIPALITAAEQYLQDNNSTMRPRDITGTSPEGLYELVAQRQPVVVLVTISMADRRETQGWYTETGTYVEWSQNDHGAVLTGYTETTVTIADPLEGLIEYPKEQFEQVYLSRGSKALSFGD